LKRDYRRFALRGLEHADDYASMEQVIGRRFKRYLEGDEKFDARPDVLFIDGGANHAAVALRALESCGLDIPVFGMVKDDRHRTRGLVTAEGREIGLQSEQSVFAFVGRIQEETHRFAIEFQRERQAAGLKKSALDGIPGVGEKRKNQLLKHFKSMKNIKSASVEQLGEVVPRNAAEAIYQHFHREEEA
jgi:excinuclease ABC subunit C